MEILKNKKETHKMKREKERGRSIKKERDTPYNITDSHVLHTHTHNTQWNRIIIKERAYEQNSTSRITRIE